MDIQTCIDEYLEFAPKIFPSKVGKLVKVMRGRQRFKVKSLELAIKRLVEKHLRERSAEGEETGFRFEAFKLTEDRSCKV